MGNMKGKAGEKNNRRVVAGTAAALILVLACFLYLGFGLWQEYRNGIIDKQKEQMLLTTEAISRNMELFIRESQSGLKMLKLTESGETLPSEGGDDELFRAYIESRGGLACDILITEGNKIIYSLNGSEISRVFASAVQDGQTISQVMLRDGRVCLMAETALESGQSLSMLLDLQDYFEKQVAELHIGTNGYVLVKNSQGIILMHPQESQLGIDVIEGREELYPGVDLTSLKVLIDRQREGGEGVMEYDSYWWMDPALPRVRKVAAWAPVTIGDDFLIVSAVMDYDDIYIPVAVGMGRFVLIFGAVTLCIVCMVLYLGKLRLDRSFSQAEISDLKRINRALEDLHHSEQSIAHQQRLQMIGTMTGGIAHEFNNLLTPILGHAELMLLDLPEDSELYDSAQEIAHSAAQCKEVIQQLSKLSRKNVETDYKLLPAQETISRVMKMVRSICPSRISLTEDLQLGETLILGNETQLSQVILNICVNAVHAMEDAPEGSLAVTGRVFAGEELSARGVALPSKLWEQYLCIDFKDSGCGMSKATLTQIFDPFFTTKRSGQGTGLGLSLAAQLIRAHKGDIWAESELGTGSTFHLLLPVANDSRRAVSAETVSGQPAQVQAETSGTSRIILLVGSNKKVLKLLADSLQEQGFSLRTATSWDAAMEILERETVYALVADSDLQSDSGLEFCMSFQGKYPDMKKVLLVDRITIEVLEAERKGFVRAYLEKPVSSEAILAALSADD